MSMFLATRMVQSDYVAALSSYLIIMIIKLIRIVIKITSWTLFCKILCTCIWMNSKYDAQSPVVEPKSHFMYMNSNESQNDASSPDARNSCGIRYKMRKHYNVVKN
jgi:hypothetical protein